MKKAFKFLAIAAIAFGMSMFVSCNPEEDNTGNGGNGNGGNNYPTSLNETFADGIPTTWTNIDADGDGYMWCDYVINGQTGEQVPEGKAVSASYQNGVGALSPDNYLVSPTITIPDGATLTYEVGGVDANYYEEYYSVYVGTLANGQFTPTATLKSETVPSVDPTTRTIDLSAYAGQNLNIAFRHYDSYDVYVMTIANVTVQ